MSIKLHKRLGVNPRRTFCPKCGGECQALVLLGSKNHTGVCGRHGQVFGIGENTTRCPAKDCGNRLVDIRELNDSESVPYFEGCAACKSSDTIQREAIERGGIAWRCKKCKSEGAMLKGGAHDDLIAEVRAKGCLGVELDLCPVCVEEQKEKSNDSQG